jgi:endonuclease/exonuclease/phosphatase family metal-dependent hydrolase
VTTVPTVRLLSYNIRSMRDDRAALIRVIRAAQPDVVCVQEAPRFARWRSRCAALARTSGLVIVGGGRAAGANLIMSTLHVDVVATHEVALSTDPRLHRRGCAVAVLRYRGVTFAVAGTHLDLVAAPRLRHVGELHEAIAASVPAPVPTVVCADVNDHPGSATWTALTEQRADAWDLGGDGLGFTSPARQPRQRIDGIFVPPQLDVSAVHVIDGDDVERASDHRPILAVLELPG